MTGRKRRSPLWPPRLAAAIAVAAALAGPDPAEAAEPRQEPLPKGLEGVGITERLDTRIPLDLAFADEAGDSVTLGRYFDQRRPVVLALVYYSCPMLCNLVLNGLTEAMQGISWTPGREFDVITVSFDPRETPMLSRLKKQSYLKEYGRDGAEAGWHFLTGREPEIRALTSAVGFGYRWNDERQEYAHQAAIYILTPDGRLARYLYGVEYDPRTLRLSLIEASEGRIGSPLDRVVLYCYDYNAASGSYALGALRLARIGGALTFLVLATWLGTAWARGAKTRAAKGTE